MNLHNYRVGRLESPIFVGKNHAFWLRFSQPNQSIDTSYPLVIKHGNWTSMNILCNWGFHGKFLDEL
jgi:hypothetical protein